MGWECDGLAPAGGTAVCPCEATHPSAPGMLPLPPTLVRLAAQARKGRGRNLCTPALALLLAMPAQAQTVDIDGARTLRQQLLSWFDTLRAPGQTDLPVEVAADGDHYRVVLPFAALTGQSAPDVSASVRPLAGGRWSVDAFQVPTTFTFTTQGIGTGPMAEPLNVTASIGAQTVSGLIDPSLASESSFAIDMRDVAWTSSGTNLRQEQRFGHYALQGRLTPAAEGRMDVVETGTVDGYTSVQQHNGMAIKIGVRHIDVTGHVAGLSLDRSAALMGATAGLVRVAAASQGVRPAGAESLLTGDVRSGLRAMVEALRGLSSTLDGEEVFDDVRVEAGDFGAVAVRRVRVGVGGDASADRLNAWMSVAVDGPSMASLPPDVAKAVPNHVSLRQSVSGVPLDALLTLALEALNEGADLDELSARAISLAADGTAQLGIDSLAVELGAARLEGSGHVRLLAADQPAGEAHVTLAGIDGLMAQASANPTLQPAVPVLVMLRGLAKPEGARLVWNVSYTPERTLVNGVDLKQMFGGQPGAPPPPRRTPRP